MSFHRGEGRHLGLVADGDPTMRSLVGEVLVGLGFDVIEAHDGVQAVEAFRAQRPDLVVLELDLPHRNGFEACIAMRETPDSSSVPILVLSGDDDVEAVTRAFVAGATDFAMKPIRWPILEHRVRYLLRAQETVEELRRSEASLEMAQRIAAMGNWEWDIQTGWMRCSFETRRLLGLEHVSKEGRGIEDLMSRVHPDDEAMFRRAVSSAIQRGSALGLDCRIVPGQGPVRFVHVQAEILHDPEGNPVSFSGTIQDISERKRAEEQIRLLAYFDGLTGLPNRVSFHDRLRKVLSTAERKGQLAAVMFLDLDNFKRINDSLGHSAGDLLLQGVAERLGALVRFSDTLSRDRDPGGEGVLSRLGGDEFTILLPGLTRPEDAAKVARRILESLRPPFPLGGSEVSATASIGIGIFPQDGANPEELLRNADAALYHAKDLGRNNFQFYAPSLNEMAALRLEMESALRVAVGREEFVVHFQPQLNAYRGQLIGIEALIRWQHPERGLLAPDLFIPLAEETGLIKSMDEWVLGAACREAARWRQAGLPSVRIAVNLSGHQFRRSDLVERLADIVAHAGLLPTDVELEITETVLMEDAQQAVLVLKELKAIGFRIAVDDFGIGYSSLNYLRKFPLDVLKIDRSFLADVPANKENEKIVAAILSLAQSLDIETIAEGVESPAQRDFLLANGCDHMQGYLFGRAMVPAEMEALLRTLAGRAAPEVATSKG